MGTLEKMAKSYSEIVGGILEDYGVSGEKEKIYQSFKSGVDQQVAEYRMFLKQDQRKCGFCIEYNFKRNIKRIFEYFSGSV